MQPIHTIPESLVSEFNKLRSRLKGVSVAGGVGLTSLVFALSLFAAFLTDYLFDLPVVGRVGLLIGVSAAGVVTAFVSVVLPLFRSVEDTELAAMVEASHPEFEERLLSTVEFAQENALTGSPLMHKWMLNQTIEKTKDVDFAEIVDAQPAIKKCWLGAASVLALLIPFIFAGNAYGVLFSRFLNPWGNYERIQNLILVVDEGDRVVARGTDVNIAARVEWRFKSGTRPDSAWLEWIPDSAGSERRRMDWSEEAQAYVCALPRVNDSFHFYVSADRSRTKEYRVEVVEPVEIAHLSIDLEPPPYTGEPAQHHDVLLGEIMAIEQSHIELEVRFNKPVESAELFWLDGDTTHLMVKPDTLPDGTPIIERQELTLSVDKTIAAWDATLALDSQAGRFVVVATDEYGLRNEVETYRRLTIVADDAPELVWGDRETNIEAKADDILDIPVQATDDFGVASLELHYSFIRGANLSEEAHLSAPVEILGVKQARNLFRLDLSKLDLKQGMQVSIRTRATDERPVPNPNETWSDTRIIRIKDDATPYGQQTLNEQQQQTKEILESLKNEVEKQAVTADELKQEAEKNINEKEEFEKDEELTELQDQIEELKQQLEKLSSVFEQSPLFDPLAEQAQNIANQQLAKAAEHAQQAQEAQLQDKPNQLNQAKEQLKQASDQLEQLQEKFEEVSELQRDLLELTRLATNTERLADNVEQLQKNQQQQVQQGEKNQNEKATSQAQQQQAQQHQELIQQHKELEQGLQQLTERRPELIEAAREKLKQQLKSIAERAEDLVKQQENLTRAAEETKHQLNHEAKENVEHLNELVQQGYRLKDKPGLEQEQRESISEEIKKLEQAREELQRGNSQKSLETAMQAAKQLQEIADAIKRNTKLPSDPQAAAQKLAERQQAVAEAMKTQNAEESSEAATQERKAIAAEENAIQQAIAQLPSTEQSKEAQNEAITKAKAAAQSTKEAKTEQAANQASESAEKLNQLAEKLADTEPNQDAEKNIEQNKESAKTAQELAQSITDLAKDLAPAPGNDALNKQDNMEQAGKDAAKPGMPDAQAEKQVATGHPASEPGQPQPQNDANATTDAKPSEASQPAGEKQPEGQAEPQSPQTVGPELIAQQTQLADQMKMLKEQVESLQKENEKAVKPAQDAAGRAENAARNAEKFDFKEGAQSAQESAKAAAVLAEALSESQAPETLQKTAQSASEKQSQLAEQMQSVAESSQAETKMQAQIQEQLQLETGALSDQLAQQSKSLAAKPVAQQSAADRAAEAVDRASEAIAEQAATNQDIQKGNQELAVQESRKATDALRKMSDQARQASDQVRDTGKEDNPVPGEVGEQVAQAAQQLNAAGEQLAQLGVPEKVAQSGAEGQNQTQGKTPGKGKGEGEGDPMQGESGQQGEQGMPQSGSSPAESLRQAAQSMRQAAGQMGLARSKQPGQPGGSSGEGSQPGDGSEEPGEFGTDQLAKLIELQNDLGKVTQRDWGQLNSEVNTDLLEASQKNPQGDYARLIKRYFQDLSKSQESE